MSRVGSVRARAELGQLRATSTPARGRRESLVHGDLHHHNILRSERGWLAIDPKPMLGEPEFDVPVPLESPSVPAADRALETRLAAFVAAGLDEERIRNWTVIRGAYLQPQEAPALLALV